MNDDEIVLRIGQSGRRISIPESIDVSKFAMGNAHPESQLDHAVRQAILSPLDFPAISAAVVPDDRIVIPIDHNTPNLVSILSAVLSVFDTLVSNICILLPENANQQIIVSLKAALGDSTEIVCHKPDDSKELAYLAASKDAEPLYLNKHILDADFVLPIALIRQQRPDSNPAAAHLFPKYADRNSQRRVYRAQIQTGRQTSSEPDEAIWLMGLQALIGIVPASGSDIARVIGGTPAGIASYATNLAQREPLTELPDLVVACIDGGFEQQTWQNVGYAVEAALRLVASGGSIVVCSELSEPPSPAINFLRTDASQDRLLKRLQKDASPDAIVASILLRARESGRLLLESKLGRESIEELGLGSIDAPEALQRLIGQHSRCAVIETAQFNLV